MPKCKYCNKNYKSAAGLVSRTKGNGKMYFCNEEHFEAYQLEDFARLELDTNINDIFGHEVINSLMKKELKELTSKYPVSKVNSYVEENKAWLTSTIQSKDFKSEGQAIKYFMAIITNHIYDYTQEQKREPLPDKNISDLILDFGEYKHVTKKKKSLSEVLEELNE